MKGKQHMTNTAVLSTGVEVKFVPLAANEVQDLVLASFSGMNLNAMQSDEVLAHGDKILRYNTTLIQDGVFLVKPLNEVVADLKLESKWLQKLLRSGKILDANLYDLNDERDREILLLRFHAFKNEEDFKLLTEKLMGG